ncbi:hypothetical protein AB0D78_44560 [Streptomyces avermitilis]|uniref:hypothetical protein n=1 Tax=Streptomyces avermitilis TaxID=33903 RepID=UPI0033F27BA5
MHRTTTTATLLVTAAVTVLSGCVTVQRLPAPAPSVAPPRPSVPRPDGSGEPQVVQAPAREALELIEPSHRPSPTAAAPHRTPPPARASAPATVPRRPHADPPAKPAQPEPRDVVPTAVSTLIPKNRDVCALGRKYGGWQPDSPEATICKRTYGR